MQVRAVFRMRFFVMTLLAVLLFASHLPAQDTARSSASKLWDEMDSIDNVVVNKAKAITERNDLPKEMLLKYREFAMKNVKQVFNWHYYSSIMIFILVVSIVVMGLYLSYRQFRLQEWVTQHSDSKKVPVVKSEDGSTTFEVGKDGIKINSAVIGLIILTISLAFFFLYLKYVYPIQMLDVGGGLKL